MVARKEVLEWDPLPMTPETLSWSAYARSADKIVNTPNVASIYMTNLQVKHMLEIGGLEYFEFMASLKSQLMYDLIDESEGFYHNHVTGTYRSRMNVPLRIKGGDVNLE